jgi:hypothetical protein
LQYNYDLIKYIFLIKKSTIHFAKIK